MVTITGPFQIAIDEVFGPGRRSEWIWSIRGRRGFSEILVATGREPSLPQAMAKAHLVVVMGPLVIEHRDGEPDTLRRTLET